MMKPWPISKAGGGGRLIQGDARLQFPGDLKKMLREKGGFW
jgi:hypothetical protein